MRLSLAMALLILACAGCGEAFDDYRTLGEFAQSDQAEVTPEILDALVRRSNAKLPRKMDGATMLTQVRADGQRCLVYEYDVDPDAFEKLVGTDIRNGINPEIKQNARVGVALMMSKQLKTNKPIQRLIDGGLEFRHCYRCEDRLISDFVFTRSDFDENYQSKLAQRMARSASASRTTSRSTPSRKRDLPDSRLTSRSNRSTAKKSKRPSSSSAARSTGIQSNPFAN